MKLLDQIKKENDIKNIRPADFPKLAEEIREFLLDKVSLTGGHVASNLGAVELTMALEEEFSLPETPEEELMNIHTVGDLADYISRLFKID